MNAVTAWSDADRADFVAAARAAISGPRAEDAAAQPATVLAPRARGILNAGMSFTSILAALSRIGWGPLRGREFAASRAILDTLALLAHDTRADLSAVVQTTARQLAKRAGYSLRHTSRCLQWLEDAGVIEWHRGGIRMGAPTMGVIKVIKRTLVDWTLAFRRASDVEDRARNAATRARIQLYRLRRNSARPKPVGAAHVDMSTPHSSLRDEGAASASPRSSREEIDSTRKDPDMKYRPSYHKYLSVECPHGQRSADRCNACKYEAIMRQQRVAEAEKAAAQRRRKEEEQADRGATGASWPPAFVEYMRTAHPDAEPRQWARLTITDARAKELINV
jgi:hypothetical protein